MVPYKAGLLVLWTVYFLCSSNTGAHKYEYNTLDRTSTEKWLKPALEARKEEKRMSTSLLISRIYYILSKSLDVCGKCNKNAHRRERQYNVTCAVYGSMLSVRELQGINIRPLNLFLQLITSCTIVK